MQAQHTALPSDAPDFISARDHFKIKAKGRPYVPKVKEVQPNQIRAEQAPVGQEYYTRKCSLKTFMRVNMQPTYLPVIKGNVRAISEWTTEVSIFANYEFQRRIAEDPNYQQFFNTMNTTTIRNLFYAVRGGTRAGTLNTVPLSPEYLRIRQNGGFTVNNDRFYAFNRSDILEEAAGQWEQNLQDNLIRRARPRLLRYYRDLGGLTTKNVKVRVQNVMNGTQPLGIAPHLDFRAIGTRPLSFIPVFYAIQKALFDAGSILPQPVRSFEVIPMSKFKLHHIIITNSAL